MQSELEQRQRAAALARMQRLPESVSPVAAPMSGIACHVCDEEDEADHNVLLQVLFPACNSFHVAQALRVQALRASVATAAITFSVKHALCSGSMVAVCLTRWLPGTVRRLPRAGPPDVLRRHCASQRPALGVRQLQAG